MSNNNYKVSCNDEDGTVTVETESGEYNYKLNVETRGPGANLNVYLRRLR